MTGSPVPLHLVIPGPLDQRTGGYLYDARMVEELRRAGREVRVHNLDGRYPDPDERARRSLDETLAGLPAGAVVLLDGLGVGAQPEILAAHTARLRLVALVHHPLADETGLPEGEVTRFRDLETRALSAVSGAVVTSEYTERRLRRFGLGPERVRVVVPGTDPAPLAEGTPAGSPPVLTCVGTVCPRKGQAELVEALRRLRDLPWSCRCVGSSSRDPAYSRRVMDAVRESELQGRIRFTGEVGESELRTLYHGTDLFVLPSHYEGYGMALTEALIRGIPVVSTTGGAIPFTVPEGAGRLVPPGDPAALAEALEILLTDVDARRRLSEEARRQARAWPGWGEQARRLGAAVEELAFRG